MGITGWGTFLPVYDKLFPHEMQDILHKSGDLSHFVTQDMVYKQSGIVLSAPRKALWFLFWQFPWL